MVKTALSNQAPERSFCMALSQKLDPGAAVALGAPLLVRLFVPLWVVNATPLPVAAWVVPIQAPARGSPDRGVGGDPSAQHGDEAGLVDAAEGVRLRVLDTERSSGRFVGEVHLTCLPFSHMPCLMYQGTVLLCAASAAATSTSAGCLLL